MSNGCGPTMGVFAKISKQPFGALRSQGHNQVVYVADSYLQGHITFESCLTNIFDTKFIARTGLC